MHKLNIGIVGCGRWAQAAHVPFIVNSPLIGRRVMSGVVDKNEGIELAKKFGFDQYIHDWTQLAQSDSISAVIISTPHQLHYSQIKTFLQNGKHVHVDKPPTLSYAEFVELSKIAEDNDLILSVHAQMKYTPGINKMKSILDSNFSDIYQVNGYFWQKLFDDFKGSWRSNAKLSGGGIMIDSGYHTIDTIHHLLDALNPSAPTFFSHQGSRDASDTVGLITYRQDKVIVSVSAIRGAPKLAQQQRIEVFGDGGYLEYKLIKGGDGDKSIVTLQNMKGELELYEYTVTDTHLSDPLHMFTEVIMSGNSLMADEITRNLKISGSVINVLDQAYKTNQGASYERSNHFTSTL